MNDVRWIRVAPREAVPAREGRSVRIGAVVCPLHGWKINLETGAIERPDVVACEGVRTYPVRVDAGIVVIGVPNRVPEPQKIQNCHIVSA
jgi:hypothetical protein